MTDEQLLRYSRHILLPEIGVEGQQKLLAASALVIGAGGLGSPAALYLAAAGVGTIVLADGDDVDLTNLQRQILHATASVGKPKVESSPYGSAWRTARSMRWSHRAASSWTARTTSPRVTP
jgi:adenylyltransferase/sulfurtransferase